MRASHFRAPQALNRLQKQKNHGLTKIESLLISDNFQKCLRCQAYSPFPLPFSPWCDFGHLLTSARLAKNSRGQLKEQ